MSIMPRCVECHSYTFQSPRNEEIGGRGGGGIYGKEVANDKGGGGVEENCGFHRKC